jgi:hypothetical protein
MAAPRRALAIAAAALACFSLAGCVTKMTEVDLRAQLTRVGAEVPKRNAAKIVVPVHAATPMEAWVFYREARGTPEASQLSLQLAQGFARGQRRRVDYIVGGPYADLADQVVLNGLTKNKGRSLAGLRIVLVSEKEPTEELRTAAKACRARLEYYALR